MDKNKSINLSTKNPRLILENAVLLLTVQLYSLSMSRSNIQKVIEIFSNFVTNTYVPFLKERFDENLFQAIDDIVQREIHDILLKFNDPFKNYNTEKKRLSLYRQRGLYSDPKECEIEEVEVTKKRGSLLKIIDKSYTLFRIPLADSLKKLLCIDGLFKQMLSYIEYLQEEKNLIINFIQGELWKNQLQNFAKSGLNVIVLPLFAYFDDLELGNALGSHAGINQIGAVYAWIPCLPPWFASKLQSIIYSDIFRSSDRKTFGNFAVFKDFIEDIRDLYENGIEIIVDNITYKIYFITSLILGDNLGVNSIFGFSSSFSNTLFCRLCYVDPERVKHLCEEDESILRTIEQYEKDASDNKNFKSTGVKEKCIFNALNFFHVIKNYTFDIMHDLFEGVCSYVLAKLLIQFIEVDKFFTEQYFNYVLQSHDFSSESGSVPTRIKMEYLKKNQKMKMSASETLFLCRYLSVLIGDQVPRGNKHWQLYLKLREIVGIVTAPFHTKADLIRLNYVIKEHHELYIELFGHLTAKFHFLLHYYRASLRNGPLMKTSSMRFESFHTIIKGSIDASCTHKNAIKSIAIRLQLSLMNQKFEKFEDMTVQYGLIVKSELFKTNSYLASNATEYKSITINGIKYMKDTIILTKITDDYVEFGKIENVFVVNGIIQFNYVTYQSQYFEDHFFAYNVLCLKTTDFIDYSSLSMKTPCLLFVIEKVNYIITKYIL